MMALTGWQAHSVRGAISGVLRKKLGLKVRCDRYADGGTRVYRIAAAKEAACPTPFPNYWRIEARKRGCSPGRFGRPVPGDAIDARVERSYPPRHCSGPWLRL
jgi:hypothetical protein